jgi:hypothetical protein
MQDRGKVVNDISEWVTFTDSTSPVSLSFELGASGQRLAGKFSISTQTTAPASRCTKPTRSRKDGLMISERYLR